MEKKSTYQIGIKLLAIVLITICSSVVYEYTFYQDVLAEDGWLKSMFERKTKGNPEYLYFSASPNSACKDSDTDKRSISKMTSDLSGYNFVSLDTGAIHAEVFLHMLKKLPENHKVKQIVMDLNLRSFGQQWINSNLENSIQRNLAYWNNMPGIVNHLKIVLKGYDYISNSERTVNIEYGQKFDYLPFAGNHQTIKQWCDDLKDNNGTDLALEMVQHFGFLIDDENKMLVHYDKIAKLCETNGIKLLFVILPEDLEAMKENAGADLPMLVTQNANLLTARFTQKHVSVLNLVDNVDSDSFYENFTTEHYDQYGRMIVAKKITKALKEWK